MPFLTETVVVKTGNGRSFELLEPMAYVTRAGTTITVPAGTRSDGASTPSVLWPLLPPFGDYWRAAILHDYLYRYTFLPRDYCDAILLEAMESLGVDVAVRRQIYDGVRLGGWKAFEEDRKELDERMNQVILQTRIC